MNKEWRIWFVIAVSLSAILWAGCGSTRYVRGRVIHHTIVGRYEPVYWIGLDSTDENFEVSKKDYYSLKDSDSVSITVSPVGEVERATKTN